MTEVEFEALVVQAARHLADQFAGVVPMTEEAFHVINKMVPGYEQRPEVIFKKHD